MLVCAISFQTHKGAEEGQGTSDDRRDDHVQGPAGADTAAIQQLIAQQEPRCKAQGSKHNPQSSHGCRTVCLAVQQG